MNETGELAIRQALRMIRSASNDHDARVRYYETVGMLRGMFYGGLIDSWQQVALTQLAGNAYINYGKPW